MSRMIDVRHLFPIDNVSWRKRDPRPQRITAVAVHHTAGFYYTPDATPEAELMHLHMIHQGHIARGFGGIGYHVVVFASGRRYWVSDYGIWGANVQGENDHVLGICAVGYFDDYIPQDLQLDGMAWGIIEMWKYRGAQVPQRPHRYWGGTACPGKRYLEWQPQLTARALALEDDMDQATFNKMFETAIKTVKIQASAGADSAYNTGTDKRTVQNFLWQGLPQVIGHPNGRVYVLAGGILIHIPNPTILQRNYVANTAFKTWKPKTTDPIWKLPRLEF